MRNDKEIDWLRVESLSALDALVGRYITGEEPQVHWEDSHAHMRFESANEALEALREPYFQQFIPSGVRATTVLCEVQSFTPYSSSLDFAWDVVEKIGTPRQGLRIWRDRKDWCAAFGEYAPVTAQTAPIAICLAALRLRGLEVVISDEADSANPRLA
jgi:Phage ABA sandwich domain